ncbi:hypothetical protein [Mesorhizobium sp. M0244]|uniref:hypothetical protein n=1 Tax=Mesorhizobium sp. M0244 TaxID=2956926 RepID=UPI00333AD3E1
MSYRVTVTWRGPGDVRKNAAETVADPTQAGELLAGSQAPQGWTTAFVAVVELIDRPVLAAAAREAT